MNLLESLEWRVAIKKFDPSKKVSQENVDKIINAANLAPTSGGLQPFKMIVISNPEVKAKLKPASFGQAQVVDSSHLIVLAIESNFTEAIVDRYIHRMAVVREQTEESLIDYSKALKQFVSSIGMEARNAWSAKQAYIALGTMISAAAELRVDACPMGGFNPLQYQEILDLKSKGLMPVVIFPIGYRSDEDVFSKAKKVRKTREDFVIEIN